MRRKKWRSRHLQIGDRVTYKHGVNNYLDGIFLGRKESNPKYASMREENTGAIIEGDYYHFFYVPTEEEIWRVAEELKYMPDEERAKIGLGPRYFGPEHKVRIPKYSMRY